MSDLQNDIEIIEDSASSVATLAEEPQSVSREAKAPRKPYIPNPAGKPKPHEMTVDEEEPDGFLQRYGVVLVVGALVLAAVAWMIWGKPIAKSEAPRKAESITIDIKLPPPPPPPPPPVKAPTPPPVEKKVEQTPIDKPMEKPVEAPVEKPADEPKGLSTTIKGAGGSGLALGTGGNGLIGGKGNGAGGGGSMAKWYGGQVANRIQSELRSNPKTQRSRMTVDAQVWVGGDARISRAKLESSTGDNSLDAALTNEILPGLQLSEPPPEGMRMPIRLRLKATRPAR